MIRVENLSKIFVTNKKYEGLTGALKGLVTREKELKKAVDNLNFNIGEGEVVGFIGNNGAGKSTSIKMMTGIMTPTSGHCYVNGIEPYKNRKKNAKNIGVVFGQRTQLWWDLPLIDSYSILKELYGVDDKTYKSQLEYLDSVLDLNKFIYSSVRTLSLGQRMRADLAASLLHNPKVIYLDEPTIGLDVLVKDKMRNAIKEINERFNTTVLLTTHDLEDIEELCKRIIIIDNGKLIFDDTIDALKEEYNKKAIVKILVDKPDKLKAVDFNKKLCVNKENLVVNAVENGEFEFVYDRKRLNISQIIVAVAEYTQIRKIDIIEQSISDIVKEIYMNGK